MRYFPDRSSAGKLLADKLDRYKNKNTALVCLSDGGVVVGLEIAKRLHSSFFLLTTENVTLPGETDPLATLSSAGTFTYNNAYSTGELEALSSDYHYLIEGKRLEAYQKLNRLPTGRDEIPRSLLKNHYVIIVSDGFKNALSLDVAADFLKPIVTKSLVVAVPVASVAAVDRMHLLADEIECLSVIEDYMETDHYFENNQLPSSQEITAILQKGSLNWGP